MIVRKLELQNFRNYDSLVADFGKGINYIYGENASGKTNILEAIYFLSLTRSFRTSDISDLIEKDKGFARILAEIVDNETSKKIEILFNKTGKKILVNGKKISKISEINKLINVVSFIPKDTNLLKESPKERRRFLNIYISKLSDKYLKILSLYEKILKERNDAFKAYKINYTLIDILANQLIELNKEIYLYRKKFIDEINKKIPEIFQKITKKVKKLYIFYESFIKNEKITDFLKKEFEKVREEELIKKQTLIGVHKDDFKIFIDEKDVSLYGSQGENRMSVISLILSIYYLTKENKPVIVLDDVISELDDYHEQNLIEFLETFDQVFITNTAKSQYFTKNYYHLIDRELKEEEWWKKKRKK